MKNAKLTRTGKRRKLRTIQCACGVDPPRNYSLDLAYGIPYIFIIISLSDLIYILCVVIVLIHWSFIGSW